MKMRTSYLSRVVTAVVFASAIAACGGGQPLSKEEAEQTLYQASRPLSGSDVRNSAWSASGASGSFTATRACAKGGKATMSFTGTELRTERTADGDVATLAMSFNATYENCTHDGKRTLNGSMTGSLAIRAADLKSGDSAHLELKLNGRIDVSGDRTDFLEVQNLTMTIDATDSATEDSATIKMNGTVKTSTETHVYQDTVISVTERP
jgi:hypothetical protein